MSTQKINEAKALVTKAGMDAIALLARIGWGYTVVDAEGTEHTNQIKKSVRTRLNNFKHHNIRERLSAAQVGDLLFFEAVQGEDNQALQSAVCAGASTVLGKGAYTTTKSQKPVGVYLQVKVKSDNALDEALRTLGVESV